ncbi:MAG: hypothetical protein ACYSUK_03250 [Planctomycetota bacterium]|jgi:hypothetical protein
MKLAFSIIVCFILSIQSLADTYIVDPNGSADYTTIQEEIDNSVNGDIIIARPTTN